MLVQFLSVTTEQVQFLISVCLSVTDTGYCNRDRHKITGWDRADELNIVFLVSKHQQE